MLRSDFRRVSDDLTLAQAAKILRESTLGSDHCCDAELIELNPTPAVAQSFLHPDPT